MNMPLVNVRRHNIFMLPLCYRVGKLLSDFMGFLIVIFLYGYEFLYRCCFSSVCLV